MGWISETNQWRYKMNGLDIIILFLFGSVIVWYRNELKRHKKELMDWRQNTMDLNAKLHKTGGHYAS